MIGNAIHSATLGSPSGLAESAPEAWVEISRGLYWRLTVSASVYAAIVLDLDAPRARPRYLVFVYSPSCGAAERVAHSFKAAAGCATDLLQGLRGHCLAMSSPRVLAHTGIASGASTAQRDRRIM